MQISDTGLELIGYGFMFILLMFVLRYTTSKGRKR